MVFLAVGVVVAVAAAAPSTGSPCGLSMLSTITPFGERARRHRYGVTAVWYLLGSTLGGATLGGAAAALAALVALVPGPGGAAWLAGAATVAAAGALVDAGAFGPVLPLVRRQVDDGWLTRYRPWVYGAGFGWQIGVGFATYLMTSGVVVVALLGVLSGSPPAALTLGVVFGVARGATVFLTARASSPSALRALHARLDRLGPGVRRAVAGAQAGGAVGLALVAAGVVGTADRAAWPVAVAAALTVTGLAGGALARGLPGVPAGAGA